MTRESRAAYVAPTLTPVGSLEQSDAVSADQQQALLAGERRGSRRPVGRREPTLDSPWVIGLDCRE